MAKKKDVSGAEDRSINQPFAALAGFRAAAPAERVSPAVPTPKIPAAKARFPDKLVLQREKKGRGGKTVTRLRGLRMSPRELEQLASELKKGLGCGATVDEGEVLLQGDQCQRAAGWLEQQGATRVVIGN